MIASENQKKLIGLLMKYGSKKFIESIVALLDSEEEIIRIVQFVENNSDATKTDIHEEIIRMKYRKK